MLAYLNKLTSMADSCYLKVSDYNTTGMRYKKADNSCPWFCFVRSAGASAKNNSMAGGSYGFGKAAYFAMSSINTILVSTMTTEGECFFEGTTSLCTHTLGNGQKYAADGYFSTNKGEPVSDKASIPADFQRDEPGTDICIMGVKMKNREDAYKNIREAVLKNFWLAIYEGKLVVKVDGEEISRENLREKMDSIFTEEDDISKRDAKKMSYAPKPYFKAVADQGKDPHCVKVERNMPTIGHVTLYAYKKKDANDKVLYMREPRMYVYSKRCGSAYGFYGVFVCDSKQGNGILRRMESVAHDEWSHTNCSYDKRQKAKDAKKDIDDFIKAAIEEMFPNGQSDIREIKGLRDFLYIPTEFEDDLDSEIEALVGKAIGDKEEEGGSITTKETRHPEKYECRRESAGIVIVSDDSSSRARPDSSGNRRGGHGNGNRDSGKGGVSSRRPTDKFSPSEEGTEGANKKEIPVSYRAFAHNVNGKIQHRLIIRTDTDIENAEIEVFVVGEQQDVDQPIARASRGKVEGNVVKALKLFKGKNVLEIEYDDNMKYTLTLYGYENQ